MKQYVSRNRQLGETCNNSPSTCLAKQAAASEIARQRWQSESQPPTQRNGSQRFHFMVLVHHLSSLLCVIANGVHAGAQHGNYVSRSFLTEALNSPSVVTCCCVWNLRLFAVQVEEWSSFDAADDWLALQVLHDWGELGLHCRNEWACIVQSAWLWRVVRYSLL